MNFFHFRLASYKDAVRNRFQVEMASRFTYTPLFSDALHGQNEVNLKKSVLFSGREEVMGRELDDPVNSKPPITAATRVLPTKFNLTRRPITWQLWMPVKVKGIELEK